MSTLREALAAFEKEQTQVTVDHEDEDDGSMAKLADNNKAHYAKVEKSKLIKNDVQTKYTGNVIQKLKLKFLKLETCTVCFFLNTTQTLEFRRQSYPSTA